MNKKTKSDEAKLQYGTFIKTKNKYQRMRRFPFNLRSNEVNELFTKNGYIPISIYSNTVGISKTPILNPKVIIVGDFEQHCWTVGDNKIQDIFKEILNRNLVDVILSYDKGSSEIETINQIKNYCKRHNVPFIYDDIPGLQSRIRSLKKLDFEYTNKVHNQKDLPKEESSKYWGIISTAGNEVYELFKKRAKYCSDEIEKRLEDKLLIQLLTLEEVSNTDFIYEELEKKNIPFVSYVPRTLPPLK